MRILLTWLPMIPIAVANGVFRQAFLLKRFSDTAARQISTIMLLALFSAYIAWCMRRWPLSSAREAIVTGVCWLTLTLIFEFGMGLAGGKTWPEMLEDYDVTAGRIWILIPLWVLVAPLLFHRANHPPP